MSCGAFKNNDVGQWFKLYGLVSFEHWLELCVWWTTSNEQWLTDRLGEQFAPRPGPDNEETILLVGLCPRYLWTHLWGPSADWWSSVTPWLYWQYNEDYCRLGSLMIDVVHVIGLAAVGVGLWVLLLLLLRRALSLHYRLDRRAVSRCLKWGGV